MKQNDGFLKKFNYAIGMFGTSIPINMLKTYAAIFYVDTLGLTTKSFALILFIYTFVDAADNPIYGFLSDRTRTRFGRRRPWLFVSAPLLALGLIAFYNVPAALVSGATTLFLYCAFFYILTGTVDSVVNANYGALFPELFPDDNSRVATNALRQAFQLVAMIISIALTPIIAGALRYGPTALVYGIVGAAVILYMAVTSRERPVTAEDKKPPLWDSLLMLFKNKLFWLTGLANAFYSAGISLVLVAMPFYVKYTLRLGSGQSTILFAAVLLVAIGFVSVWAQLVKRYGLVRIWRIAIATLSLAFVALYFATSLPTAIVGAVLVGVGFAGVIATMDLIGARIMDEDQRKHHMRREGIISNAMGFMNRLNGLFTSAGFVLVSVLYGFESGDVPGPMPDQAARFLLTMFPFVLMLISLGFSLLVNFPAAGAQHDDAPDVPAK